ncbi:MULTISPECIES: 3-hydroxyacyl-ACP dehydratase FabZ family protein [Bizionia]|uniref:Hydroxymyristoyl-ACP dehydratase n=1 Tax=Bizionia algoritergicola TaxID=291187 RepID=A0A5D0R1E1_9FLAO|nr:MULTISPECIES: FabA/FabZ family ACP-dehydratase [Bizionia]OBX24410.1 hydroxymyristoyl-ACP dehydratase [Bizionia sp. APA-3]TYB75332.1 hydroxymyristoyl-ACP dehydratase [Bizionia algoritergicola]
MTGEDIIAKLPYQKPFLFVDELLEIDENGISGTYTFHASSDFYKGHFINNPVTPGVILTETMAQIGLVSFGIYLMNKSGETMNDIQIALTSSEIDFFKPVFPGEKVFVKSEKEYFRFNKLKCKVDMFNIKNELVCRGKIAGMIAGKMT